MTLQIVSVRVEGELRIQLHGRLTGLEIAELRAACASQTPPLCIRIDLENLSGASPEGILALKELRASGAQLAGASPYIELLLGDRSGGVEPRGHGSGTSH